jgi:hypothetical protein
MGVGLFLFPILMALMIYKNEEKIRNDDPEFKERFDVLTKDVHVNRNPNGIYYLPMNIMRKVIFVNIPLFMP